MVRYYSSLLIAFFLFLRTICSSRGKDDGRVVVSIRGRRRGRCETAFLWFWVRFRAGRLEFGCDLRSDVPGEQFRGLKLLPPGLRFFHYSCGKGLKQAFFAEARARQVIVRTWDKKVEDFAPHETGDRSSSDVCEAASAALRGDLDSNLGAYAIEDYNRWNRIIY